MKIIVMLLLASSVQAACRQGYVPTDVQGVCQASSGDKTNPAWVSDEKPPEDKMPSWQREGVTVVNAPNMAAQDEKDDQERAEAIAEGRRRAGLKPLPR